MLNDLLKEGVASKSTETVVHAFDDRSLGALLGVPRAILALDSIHVNFCDVARVRRLSLIPRKTSSLSI